MLNRVHLIGNLGQDPKTRTTQKGDEITTFSIATTVRVGNEDQTDWHRIVTFGKVAESCSKYLTKGRLVYIEGRLQYRKFERSSGEESVSAEIIADRVQFLGPKNSGAERQSPGEQDESKD